MIYLINYHHELLLSFVMIVAALGDASNPHMLVDGFDSHGCAKKKTTMIRSLRNIKPIPTSRHVGEKRVLLSSRESGCSITQVAVTDLKAGEESTAHVHADMQEAFFVLDGELEATLSDESHCEHIELCHKDDFLYVDAGTSHKLRAITDVRILTIGCNRFRGGQALQIILPFRHRWNTEIITRNIIKKTHIDNETESCSNHGRWRGLTLLAIEYPRVPKAVH